MLRFDAILKTQDRDVFQLTLQSDTYINIDCVSESL